MPFLRLGREDGCGPPAPAFGCLLQDTDDGEERTRFGALARRLWEPIFACESVGAP